MVFVYVTDDVEKAAKSAGLGEDIRRVAERIEADEASLGSFDPLGGFLKKRLRAKRRLIAQTVNVGTDTVLVFLELLHRNDTVYNDLLIDKGGFGERRWGQRVEQLEGELEAWIQGRRDEGRVPEPRPGLPDDLRPWLEPPRWAADDPDEPVVLETREWMSEMARVEPQAQARYYDLVGRLVNGEPGEPSLALPPTSAIEGHGRMVFFWRHEDAREPHRKALLLVSAGQYERVPKQLVDLLQRGEVEYSELSRWAGRAYPSYLLADENAWYAIESDQEANLALSPEEESLLQSISRPVAGAPPRPVFINGRAGSGKSTMLAYLFADYLERCLSLPEEAVSGRPVFLTYNRRLVEIARKSVRSILSTHSRFVGGSDPSVRHAEIDRLLREAFQPFRQFLRSRLPSDLQERFSPQNHIGYARFKRLYRPERALSGGETAYRCQLPRASRIAPEMAWHVIRAYIKGRRLDESGEDTYLSPEEYKEVPAKQRSVEHDIFEEVHDTIWTRWYRRLSDEHELWDDQDLIRCVLERPLDGSDIAAVFCDEAQDFTAIEFELIMKLSCLTRYDLGVYPPRSLPFAFAGDPLQTVNPTGFRWSDVGAIFHDTVVRSLDPTNRWNLRVEPEELELNYRSTAPVVKVGNLVQLWRSLLSSDDITSPQRPWRPDDGVSPTRFVLGRNLDPAKVASSLSDTIVIIPCEEGEEAAFCAADPCLKALLDPGEPTTPPRNVLSASTAKGLEFDRVVVYRFGDACPDVPWDELPAEQPLGVQYFFNKLYVAVSRARKHLFIVDTPEGDGKLWARATDESCARGWALRAERGDRWNGLVAHVDIAPPGSFTEMEEQNPREIAREFEIKGLQLQLPELLERAAKFYGQVGEETKSKHCLAWANRFSGRHAEAAALFSALGDHTTERECLWDGECWTDLAAWYAGRPDEPSAAVYLEAARFMGDATRPRARVEGITEALAAIQGGSCPGLAESDSQWQTVFDSYAKHLVDSPRDALDPPLWAGAARLLESWPSRNRSLAVQSAGHCFVKAGADADACRCWEAVGATDHSDYYLARARLSVALEDKVRFLQRAGDEDAIADLWDATAAEERAKCGDLILAAAPILEQRGRLPEVLAARLDRGDVDAAIATWRKNPKAIPKSERESVGAALLKLLLSRKGPMEGLRFVEELRRAGLQRDEPAGEYEALIVSAFSHSALDHEQLTKAQHKRLAAICSGLVTSTWRTLIGVEGLGGALERLGHFLNALTFYEAVISDPAAPEAEKRFAQLRWLAVKARQITAYKGDPNRASEAHRSEQSFHEHARRWKIRPDEISLEYPVPGGRSAPIADAPPEAEIVEESGGWWSMTYRGFAVRFHPERMRLSVTELSSGDRLLWLDLLSDDLSSDRKLTSKRSDGTTSFLVVDAGVRGEHGGAEAGSLRLELSGNPVRFELAEGAMKPVDP